MRIAYLDCFAGISGDMFLGALVDVGVPLDVLQSTVATLNLGVELKAETVDRSGISCTKVNVLVNGKPADGAGGRSHSHSHEQQHHTHEQHQEKHFYRRQPQTQHLHKGGHAHEHEHPPHEHGRSLSVIRAMIQNAALDAKVKATAIQTFELLGKSEAKIHNVAIEKIHFHEVGAVDAIADIVAAAAGIHALAAGKWVCSPLNVGSGMVDCAHGRFPVPAPATADLLRGAPTYSSGPQMELVTPTGAALVRALGCEFSTQPAMRVEKIGYGAGSRNPKDFPNVLRLSIGESDSTAADTVIVLETTVDDCSPELLGFLMERALSAGALDVTFAPVQMKQNRPATHITVLAQPKDAASLQELLFRETSTLGIRVRQEQRVTLQRKFITVSTAWGDVRIKLGLLNEEVVNAAPEFADCRALAEKSGIALKQIMQAALAAYYTGKAK